MEPNDANGDVSLTILLALPYHPPSCFNLGAHLETSTTPTEDTMIRHFIGSITVMGHSLDSLTMYIKPLARLQKKLIVQAGMQRPTQNTHSSPHAATQNPFS